MKSVVYGQPQKQQCDICYFGNNNSGKILLTTFHNVFMFLTRNKIYMKINLEVSKFGFFQFLIYSKYILVKSEPYYHPEISLLI